MPSADVRLRRWRLIDAGVLSVAISLRVLLALVNQEANDDHLEVAQFIADQGRIPSLHDVRQGVQPKLYHLVVASLWSVFDVPPGPLRRTVAQLVSCAASIGTLLLARRFLRAVRATEPARRVAFVVVALNPSLIGIGAQATNDALVIFLVSLVLLAGERFFSRPSAGRWFLLTMASVLAPLAKGNGLVVLPAVAAAFLGARLAARDGRGPRRGWLVTAFAGWAVVVASALAACFPFGDHYRLFGSPFDDRADASGIPAARDAFVVRPGVRSIPDALLTFRLVDLLQRPTIDNGVAPIPLSRTSLWSTLYGRFHFSRYASWPPSWQSTSAAVEAVGRIAFVLGLPAGVLLAAAIAGRACLWLRSAARRSRTTRPPPATTLVDVTVAGYLAFIVAFALAYRDFSFMKDIFVLPGILAFAALFAQALSTLGQSARGRGPARLVTAATFLLAGAYVVDVAVLAWQLAPRALVGAALRPETGRDPSADVACGCVGETRHGRVRTKTSPCALTSNGIRFVASDSNTTARPLPLITGVKEVAFPGAPPDATLARTVVPVLRS